MGAYLSKPITKKISSDQVGKNLVCGASSMQGWRMSQEDAHNCCIDFDEDASLFAVYDGHGGHEVATYCSNNLPDFIKNTEAYKAGDIKQALIDAFLKFDSTLATPEVVSILKKMASGGKVSFCPKEDGDESDVEENVKNLCMEATMPLDQVIAKYQTDGPNPSLANTNNENCTSESHFPSPYLRSRRNKDRGACSSSGAGCSTSSSSWNTNEADVSSSSQPCESSSSTSNRKTVETAGSSEADQILDSTTSNGDVPRTSQVGSSADSQPTKSSEMPDSSEDINDNVSASKVAQSSSTVNEAEINGENSNKVIEVEVADSSKNANENECSSSCAPLENGEAEQQENISSSGRRRNQIINFYNNLLNKEVDDSDDDDDDDDENDQTFDGQPESDDDGDVENDGSHDEEEEEEDDDDDDDEDDDEDEDEDDEDDTNPTEFNEEPGSDSGCTAVVAVLKGKQLYVANAGDSRCVLCRDGKAIELSLDHKPEDVEEMKRIVKAGGKVTAHGRVNGGLNLSRAFGDHAYKKNKDLPPEEQMISALPDIKTIELDPEKDEFMVLACDGIWNFMSSEKVIDFIRPKLSENNNNISKICEELFDQCLAPNTLGDGTGCDNMTAIIVQFKSEKELKENNVESTSEVTSVGSKRPILSEATDGTEDSVIDDCKRFKTC